jgi:hypothetical protein
MSGIGTRRDGRTGDRGAAAAWIGVVTGPTAWVLQLLLDWAVGEVVGCAPASRQAGMVLGLDVRVIAAIVSTVLLVATMASGVIAYRRWRSIRRGDVRASEGGAWLAMAGVLTAGLFTIVIAPSFLPIVMIEGCG